MFFEYIKLLSSLFYSSVLAHWPVSSMCLVGFCTQADTHHVTGSSPYLLHGDRCITWQDAHWGLNLMELVQHSPEANIAVVVHLLLLFSFHLAGNVILVIWCSLLQITSRHFFKKHKQNTLLGTIICDITMLKYLIYLLLLLHWTIHAHMTLQI